MNLRDLEYVLALHDAGHFGHAANACHVSQPALSTQIKKLEEELGFRLFERTPRGITAVPEADFIIASARMIVARVQDMKGYARTVRNGTAARILHLGVIPTIAPYYLGEFMARVGAIDGPAMQWRIHEAKTGDLLRQMSEGRIDIALLSSTVSLPEGIVGVTLFDEPFFLAIAADHPLAARPEIDPAELPEDDWLLLDEGHCLSGQVLALCGRASGVGARAFRATSLETLRHMLTGGTGVTLMPRMAVRDDDGIAYVPLRDRQFCRPIRLIWRTGGRFGELMPVIAAACRSDQSGDQSGDQVPAVASSAP